MPRIATLGPRGSFSEEAAILYGRRFQKADTVLFSDPEQIIRLDKGIDFGLVAIENSLEGTIGHTLDLIGEMEFSICDEIVLKIRHFLMTSSGDCPVSRIYSHPAAFAQCRGYLKREYPESGIITVSSTAQGALQASQEKGSAAIASRRAAEIYGLELIDENIQDQDSYTRFIVIGHESPEITGSDKTSIFFSTKDQPGALYAALRPFAERSLNLTKIESRPARKELGDYVFFLDFQGHISEQRCQDALEELSESCVWVKVLGSYPAAPSQLPPSRL